MPNALGIGLLGPLQVRDETGRPVHVGGRQLRVLLTLLALNAGRVVPAGSLAGELWPDDPPGNAGLVPLARVAEHDLVPGRHRGPPTARCLPALARRLLARGLRLRWRARRARR